ncbi:hypothetical protein JB92DRAFT_3127644 [Gautieria morchelliformis]|nr:hypothetical protein JB92DRAFT_3127644 [Gautieria morchelliformis]
MGNKAIVTGYYRYTDINFEHQVIQNPSDRSALKALIAPESLTHPDNPLNVCNGTHEPGVTLTMGTMENGESRLLFSSQQVEYMRYWLHAVGFTTSRLPIPSSNYLLTESSLKSTSPVTYKTGAELKAAVKDIQKNNKRLKGTDRALLSIRLAFERVRTCWSEHKGTWIAIDFEGWEMEHTLITEYGYSLVTWRDGQEVTENAHCIVEERRKYQNTNYVMGNRDHFLFGTSKDVRLSEMQKLIHDQITFHSSNGPLFLVFHDYSQDIKYLKSLNAPIDGIEYELPDLPPDQGIYVVDTRLLFGALEGRASETRGLSRMCALLQIPNLGRFHNAGNDSHVLHDASHEIDGVRSPVDMQREARWPSQETQINPRGTKGVSVEWEPHQIDSDPDEDAMEDIFPPGPGGGAIVEGQ